MQNKKQKSFLKIPLIYLLIFLAGFASCILLIYLVSISDIEKPIGFDINSELESPGDWIKTNQIELTQDSIIIHVSDASLSKYAATGSMKPILDKDSNGIRITPTNPEDIKIGDIITFGEENIVHRVIDKGEDEQGIYFITQGDNNFVNDGKIRFEEIKYITIGILY